MVPGTFLVMDKTRQVEMEEVVAGLAPRLLAYCTGRVGCHALAEEAAQDALSALVERWRRHGPPENPAAFAFAIARRRAGRAAFRRALLRPLETLAGSASNAPGPAELLERSEEVETLRRALGRLSAKDREILLLVAAGELSYGEVAGVLGLSLSAVKMRISRARQRLGSLMEVIHAPT